MPSAMVAYSGTLVANTVQTVTLTEARGSVRVVNRSGAADIWFTVAAGGTPAAPTVGGADCYVASGVAGAAEEVQLGSGPESVQVSLISSGVPTFTVETNQAD